MSGNRGVAAAEKACVPQAALPTPTPANAKLVPGEWGTNPRWTNEASLGHLLFSAHLNEMEVLFLFCPLWNGEETQRAWWALSSWGWRFLHVVCI